MSPLRARWIFGVAVLAAAAVVYAVVHSSLVIALRPAALVSGWSLFAVIVLLTFFNARKKLPFLPILRGSTWLQIHIYAGLFTLVLYLFHTSFRVPQGVLEQVLACVFFAVNLSGIAGLGLSRWLPPRLTVYGENLIFERIPALRTALGRQVEQLVLESVSKTKSDTISDFYVDRLRYFFARPRYLVGHLLGHNRALHRLQHEAEALDRYLSPEERQIMSQINECIRLKGNLDLQFAGQGLLKAWLFLHIPLTYALLLFGLVHGLLAWRLT